MTISIIFFLIVMVAALIFIIFAITAFSRKTPMFFWAGTAPNPEEIKDIPAFNKANGYMWLIYGCFYIMTALFSFYNVSISAIILGGVAILGIPILVKTYKRIYTKYKR